MFLHLTLLFNLDTSNLFFTKFPSSSFDIKTFARIFLHVEYFVNFTKNKTEPFQILNLRFYLALDSFSSLSANAMSLFFSFNLLKQNLYYSFPSIIFLISFFSSIFSSIFWKCSMFPTTWQSFQPLTVTALKIRYHIPDFYPLFL